MIVRGGARRNENCTKCAFHGKGNGRCAICAGPSDEPNHHGASHVSIDAMPDGGVRLLSSRLETGISPARIALSEEGEDVARRILSFFITMSLDEFALVKHLLAGRNLSTYASINNKPRQYVWNAAMKMMRRSPEMRAIVKERNRPSEERLREICGSGLDAARESSKRARAALDASTKPKGSPCRKSGL